MSFWSRLWGSDESIKTAVEGVRDGLDALVYTDEEKARDDAEERKNARNMLIEWVKNTQGQNLSRRLLAISISFSWLAMKFAGLIVGIFTVYSSDTEKLKEVIRLIDEFSSDMTPAVMLILGFYFAAPHMGSIAKAALSRFGERNTVSRVKQ